MNLPNKLSVLRIALVPVVVLLLYLPGDLCRWLAVAVFMAAAFTDYLDGHIARKNGLVTDFGKFIDPVADKLLGLCTLIMLCHEGLMASWAVCVILARELCVDGLRMIAVGKGKVIAASWWGKVKTVSQLGLILWQLVLRHPLTLRPAADPLGFVAALGTAWAVIITIVSGADYFKKNGSVLLESK